MCKNEDNEIKKLENAETKRLEAFFAKKSLERSRREAKKLAHKKVVSRVQGKLLVSKLKFNAISYLRDVGHFKNRFDEDILQGDVLPWLH